MSTPSKGMVHIDTALTNISVAYIQNANNFVADKVFPMVPVKKESDRYFVYSKEDFFRDEAELRAPATESAGGGYEIDNTPTYFAQKYSYHKDVTERDRVNADSPLSADRDATIFVSQKMLIRRESLWAQKYFKTGVWANEFGGAATANTAAGDVLFWNDPTADPIKQIGDAQVNQESTTGYRPNTLTIGARVYEALRNHPAILDRIKYTERGIVTTDLLASLFDVDKVLIARGVKNNSARGLKGASADINYIFGDHALLTYAPSTPSLMTPSAGYTFAWTGLLGAGAYGNRMTRLPMDWLEIGTERIEADMAFDQKVVAADMGTLFETIIGPEGA
jgi:hypothetical protein